jgi:ribosomal RNA small subunit methyltransferase A
MSSVATSSSVRQTIQSHSIKAKKALGQNFILNSSVTHKIASLVPVADVVLEIGPGPASLTRPLIKQFHPSLVIGIEKDDQFLPILDDLKLRHRNFKYLHRDALQVDHQEIMDLARLLPGDGKAVQITGNLPFNVSTNLLLKWMDLLHAKKGVFEDRDNVGFTLMFQKEVAQRIIAQPGTPERSKLSVLVQSLCKTKLMATFPSSVFSPRPKVDAAIVRLTPLAPSKLNGFPMKHFKEFIFQAFSAPRKMIRNNLKGFDLEILEKTGVDPMSRPADLTTEQLIELAKSYQFSKKPQ